MPSSRIFAAHFAIVALLHRSERAASFQPTPPEQLRHDLLLGGHGRPPFRRRERPDGGALYG